MEGLVVRLGDDVRHLRPRDRLTFGRAADLVVDEANPYLHRHLGTIEQHDDVWYLVNAGSLIDLEVDVDGLSRTVLSSGASMALVGAEHVVDFAAARARYRLVITREGETVGGRVDPPSTGETTGTWGIIELNHEHRLLLIGLAEPRLRGGSEDVPTMTQLARRLGWTRRRVARKIDHLCVRFSDVGVPGLRGERGDEAVDRRHLLVDHVLRVRLIDADDLALLPPAAERS